MDNTTPYFEGEPTSDNPKLAEFYKNLTLSCVRMTAPKMMVWVESFLLLHGLNPKRLVTGDQMKMVTTVSEEDSSKLQTMEVVMNKVQLMNAYSISRSILSQINHNNIGFKATSEVADFNATAEFHAKRLTRLWKDKKINLHAAKSLSASTWAGEMIFRIFEDDDRLPTAAMVNPLEFFISSDFNVDFEESPYLFTRKLLPIDEAYAQSSDFFDSYEDFKRLSGLDDVTNRSIFNPTALLRDLYLSKMEPETRQAMLAVFSSNGFNLSALDMSLIFAQSYALVPVYEIFHKPLQQRVVMYGQYVTEVEKFTDKYPFAYTIFNQDGLTKRGVSDLEQALPYEKVTTNLLNYSLQQLADQLSQGALIDERILPNGLNKTPFTSTSIKLPPGKNLQDAAIYIQRPGNFQVPEGLEQKLEREQISVMGSSTQLLALPTSTYNSASELNNIQQATTAGLAARNSNIQTYLYRDMINKISPILIESTTEDKDLVFYEDGRNNFYKYLTGVTIEDKGLWYLYTHKRGDTVHEYYRDKSCEVAIQQAMGELANPDSSQPYQLPPESGKPRVAWQDFVKRVQELTQGTLYPLKAIFTAAELKNANAIYDIDVVQGLVSENTQRAQKLASLMPFLQQIQQDPLAEAMVAKIFQLNGEDLYALVSKEELEKFRQSQKPQVSYRDLLVKSFQIKYIDLPASSQAALLAQLDIPSLAAELEGKKEDQQAQSEASQEGLQTPIDQSGNLNQGSLAQAFNAQNLSQQTPGNTNLDNAASVPGNPLTTGNASGSFTGY